MNMMDMEIFALLDKKGFISIFHASENTYILGYYILHNIIFVIVRKLISFL